MKWDLFSKVPTNADNERPNIQQNLEREILDLPDNLPQSYTHYDTPTPVWREMP